MSRLVRFSTLLLFVCLAAGARPAVADTTRAVWTEDFVESVGFVVKLHYRGDEFLEVVEPILLESGVRYVRDGGIKPHVVENAKRLYNDHGIRFTMVADPRDTIMPHDVVEKLIVPFEGAVIAVEGPNEWDNRRNVELFDGLVWPEHMQRYQQGLFEAIKSHEDPMVHEVMVLSPSLAHPHRAADELGDLTDVIDAVNLHPYQGGALPLDQWETKWLPGALATSSSKPIVITETGYHYMERASGQPGISDEAGGRYVPRLFLDMFRMGVARTHYYNLSPNPWGDIRPDGTPRPSIVAVGNLIHLLQDPPTDGTRPYEAHASNPFQPGELAFNIEGGDEDLRHLLFQKRDGRFYLVLWLDKVSFDLEADEDVRAEPQSVTVTLATPMSAATFLPSQSRESVATMDTFSELKLSVPDHPLVVELTPSD
ncbi:MAG: hypothetical protein AAF561_02215 [Planctomycetota bacterium]